LEMNLSAYLIVIAFIPLGIMEVISLCRTASKKMPGQFGVSEAAVWNKLPSGQMLAESQTSEGQNKLAFSRSQRWSGSPQPTHTLLSAVPVLDKAQRSTADTKANPPSPTGRKGTVAAAVIRREQRANLSSAPRLIELLTIEAVGVREL
jgi:hypothetical protein